MNSQLPVCQALKEIPVGLQFVVGWNMNESDPVKITKNRSIFTGLASVATATSRFRRRILTQSPARAPALRRRLRR